MARKPATKAKGKTAKGREPRPIPKPAEPKVDQETADRGFDAPEVVAAPEPKPAEPVREMKTIALSFNAFSDQGRREIVEMCTNRGWVYGEFPMERRIEVQMFAEDEIPAGWQPIN